MAICRPQSEAELAASIAAARTPLAIRGGGTRGFAPQVFCDDLDVTALRGISLYEPGALTIVADAGTPLVDVQAALAAKGQQLAFEPMDHRGLLGTTGEPTIGGVVAGNISGPRRIQAGACRDFLLGVRFVDGTGRIIKNGGRVMKNVTGYDLVKLLAGSFGTLGVLSEVALKVLAISETQVSVVARGLSDRQGVAMLTRALGSPFDVTGAAHLACVAGNTTTMIRLEGFTDSVAYRADRLATLLADFGDISIDNDGENVAAQWAALRDVREFSNRPGDVWRISVKPSDGPLVGDRMHKITRAQIIYDLGGGLVWLLVPAGTDVRRALADIDGHARLERASDPKFATFASQGPVLDKVSGALREKFDPRGILNPGLMG